MTDSNQVAVIGTGPIDSAAAKYLGESGLTVRLIGCPLVHQAGRFFHRLRQPADPCLDAPVGHNVDDDTPVLQ